MKGNRASNSFKVILLFAVFSLMIPAASMPAFATNAGNHAHDTEVVDQINDVGNTNVRVHSSVEKGQTFIPTADNLVAVDLDVIGNVGSFDLTVKIKEVISFSLGSCDDHFSILNLGPTLGSGTASAPGVGIVHIDITPSDPLASSVPLTIGGCYALLIFGDGPDFLVSIGIGVDSTRTYAEGAGIISVSNDETTALTFSRAGIPFDVRFATYSAGEVSDPLRDQKQAIADELTALLPTGDKKTDKKIEKAVKHITKSLKDDRWLDDNTLVPKKGKKVFDDEKKAVKECNKAGLAFCVDGLLEIDRRLAQNAIDAAQALVDAADPLDKDTKKAQKEIDKANKEMTKAQKELDKDKPKPDKAVKKYKKAWEHAQKAIKKLF